MQETTKLQNLALSDNQLTVVNAGIEHATKMLRQMKSIKTRLEGVIVTREHSANQLVLLDILQSYHEIGGRVASAAEVFQELNRIEREHLLDDN